MPSASISPAAVSPASIQITAVFFARLKREMGLEQLRLEVAAGATVRQVAAQLEAERGGSLRGCMVAVNETYAQPDQTLQDGDEVAFLPPVAGGSGEPEINTLETDTLVTATLCEITDQPLSLAQADAFLVRPEYGAQAYFVGTVRSPNAGKTVEFIDYEGFVPLARKVMKEAAAAARQQYGELRIVVQHRTGRLYPAEASILIGVASPHRRAALEACDFLIEHLKVHVPVWKHEVDEAGEQWVAGQTPHETL